MTLLINHWYFCTIFLYNVKLRRDHRYKKTASPEKDKIFDYCQAILEAVDKVLILEDKHNKRSHMPNLST